jgi:hypothetical protein
VLPDSQGHAFFVRLIDPRKTLTAVTTLVTLTGMYAKQFTGAFSNVAAVAIPPAA